MEVLLDRLKRLLRIKDNSENGVLHEILLAAIGIFLDLKYPYGGYQAGRHGIPELSLSEQSWVLRAAIEIYNREGVEGQTSHSENGISRAYESGTISNSLKSEIIPHVGVANARS